MHGESREKAGDRAAAGGMLRPCCTGSATSNWTSTGSSCGASGERVPLEPQVFALLALLVDARDRAVTKDEIFEKVWDGRAVTDSALASRVKSARQALGDDGRAQRHIRTDPWPGFRFVAKVSMRGSGAAASPAVASPDPPPRADAAPTEPDAATRPSIAVLPFRLAGDDGHDTYATTLADALPDELIVDLSRLRWLFVTARGSSFRLRNRDIDAREVGRLLGVRYCLSGTIEASGLDAHVSVELVDTRDGGVVWAERYDAHGSTTCTRCARTSARRSSPRSSCGSRCTKPRSPASAPTESLDAWSAYHLGLQHVYRFNRARQRRREGDCSSRRSPRDPRFARAHAGLSFVHFQAAFLR